MQYMWYFVTFFPTMVLNRKDTSEHLKDVKVIKKGLVRLELEKCRTLLFPIAGTEKMSTV